MHPTCRQRSQKEHNIIIFSTILVNSSKQSTQTKITQSNLLNNKIPHRNRTVTGRRMEEFNTTRKL